MDHPFRSAALGGFNRQDVLDYLEKTSAENAQRQQELQQNLEAAEEERRQLAAKTAEQEEQLSILHRERDSLSQQLEQVQQALAASQDREEAQERELAALRQERDGLKDRVAALEPEAAAYEAVKERTAGVELEAHCRAQNILDQANGQAKDLRRSMEQWMGRVEREYDALRSEVESTVSHASDKLDKANKALEQVTDLLEQQSAAWDRLTHSYEEGGPLLEESASSPEQ